MVRNLFGEGRTKDFALVPKREFYQKTQNWVSRPSYTRMVLSRMNGELCAFNTMRIIKHYRPLVFVIENPATSQLWRYYREILNFNGMKNIACYNDYDEAFSQKPTCFYSNLDLCLKVPQYRQALYTIGSGHKVKKRHQKMISGYNKRSNIPLLLIKDILTACLRKIESEEK